MRPIIRPHYHNMSIHYSGANWNSEKTNRTYTCIDMTSW